jgi:hypothetical protein
MRACARRGAEHARVAHRTVYRTCPVHHRTARRAHKSELQRSEPNGLVAWLAHRTVRCARRQQPPPTVKFGGWGYKYPNHPHIQVIPKRSNPLPTPHKALVIRESDLLCSFELLRLDCFFLSFFLAIISFVIEARDTNCVVVLAGTLCSD